MGKLTFFLGFQIHQCKSRSFLSYKKYARNMIKKFGMKKFQRKSKRTLVAFHLKVSKDDSSDKVDERL